MTWLYKDSDMPGIFDIFTSFFLFSDFSGLSESFFSSYKLTSFILLLTKIFELDIDETSSFFSLTKVFLGSGFLKFGSSFFISCFDSI